MASWTEWLQLMDEEYLQEEEQKEEKNYQSQTSFVTRNNF
jgi:hypothetical protein